jgi:hypothetical protein
VVRRGPPGIPYVRSAHQGLSAGAQSARRPN